MDEQKYNLEESLAELDKLFDLSAKEIDKTACEDLAEKARTIYEQYPESEDIALRYAMTVVYLSGKQKSVEERINTANSVKEIFERFKQSEDIASLYSMVLVNLSAKQENIEELLNSVATMHTTKQSFQNYGIFRKLF